MKTYSYYDTLMLNYELSDWSKAFDDYGFSPNKDGYEIIGLYRSDCTKIYCIEKAVLGKGNWGNIL